MFIQEVELFQGIPSYVISEISELVTQENYPAGHVLFREGDVADFLYTLEEGEINLIIQAQKEFSFPVMKGGSVHGHGGMCEG